MHWYNRAGLNAALPLALTRDMLHHRRAGNEPDGMTGRKRNFPWQMVLLI